MFRFSAQFFQFGSLVRRSHQTRALIERFANHTTAAIAVAAARRWVSGVDDRYTRGMVTLRAHTNLCQEFGWTARLALAIFTPPPIPVSLINALNMRISTTNHRLIVARACVRVRAHISILSPIITSTSACRPQYSPPIFLILIICRTIEPAQAPMTS